MRILADANPIYSEHLTGIGYFTDELLKHLEKECELKGFAFNFKGKKKINKNFEVQEQRFLPGKILAIPRYFSVDLPLRLFFKIDCDLVLGTNFLLPPTGKIKNILVVHDLCFIDHPEWVQGRNALILRKMLGKSLSRSSAVITISKFTAEKIKEHYDYKKPILVIGIPPKKSDAGLLVPNKIVNEKKFFLFISTIEPRKNVSALLDAYESLPKNTQEKHSLILAGKPGWDEEALKRLRLNTNKNIVYLEYVNESEKNWLYKNALATVVPSHYEGFGMMTLESLDANTPVITSDISPQREILGSSGQYFEPSDKLKLSELMLDMTDPKTREDVLIEQSKFLKKYSWDKTTHEIMNFCKDIISKI